MGIRTYVLPKSLIPLIERISIGTNLKVEHENITIAKQSVLEYVSSKSLQRTDDFIVSSVNGAKEKVKIVLFPGSERAAQRLGHCSGLVAFLHPQVQADASASSNLIGVVERLLFAAGAVGNARNFNFLIIFQDLNPKDILNTAHNIFDPMNAIWNDGIGGEEHGRILLCRGELNVYVGKCCILRDSARSYVALNWQANSQKINEFRTAVALSIEALRTAGGMEVHSHIRDR